MEWLHILVTGVHKVNLGAGISMIRKGKVHRVAEVQVESHPVDLALRNPLRVALFDRILPMSL